MCVCVGGVGGGGGGVQPVCGRCAERPQQCLQNELYMDSCVST